MAKRNFDVTNTADTPKKQKNSRLVNLEENYLMPSLQHASMTRVAITLWNQADIKHQIVKLFTEFNVDDHKELQFLQIVKRVLENLLQLGLPNRVRKMLSKIVHPIGNEIFVWMKYQNDHVFYDKKFRTEKSIAINYIDDLVWTPRGIIDCKETAKTVLAKGGILSDLQKYKIACEYCLEDDIAIIAPKVNSLKLMYTRQAMVCFWTVHMTGDTLQESQFYNLESNAYYNFNECIFKVLIDKSRNAVAIKYIWDKLSHEEQSRQRVYAVTNTLNNEFRFFLLSQISEEQEREVFECNSSKVLNHFQGDWLWGHYYLPIVHNVLHIMHESDYFLILNDIVTKMEGSHEDIAKYNEYKAIFKEVWKWAPKHLKDYLFKEIPGYWSPHVCIFIKLFYKKNIDIIQSMLSDLNDVQKKIIMFSVLLRGEPLWKLKNLITGNKLDLLEWLIGRTLFCREEVECFKHGLMIEIGQEIAVHFIQNKEWNKLQQFLKWAFISDDDIMVFKLRLATTSKICPDILKAIVENNNADFTELEYFFEWCASGNAEKVTELKKNMFGRRDCFDTVIGKLVQEDTYELLEQILNWCFDYDQKQVAQFKQYFYQDDQKYM